MSVADLDAAFLPPVDAVRRGFRVFNVLTGTLHKLGRGEWEDVSEDIPDGKVWLTPKFDLVEREGGKWQTLARA